MARKISGFTMELTGTVAMEVAYQLEKRSPTEVCQKLEEIERAFLLRSTLSAKRRSEVKCSIQSRKFKFLSQLGLPSDDIDTLFGDACKVGFSSFLDEGTVKIFYAQYSMQHSNFQRAREVLEGLLTQVRDCSSGPSLVRKSLKADILHNLQSIPPST